VSKKILILGSIPEPVGGVTIHVYHLATRLHLQGFDVTVGDINRKGNKYKHSFRLLYNPFKILWLARKMDIVHVHVSGLSFMNGLFALVIPVKNGFWTVHSGNFHRSIKERPTALRLFKKLLKKYKNVVCLNEDIYTLLTASCGVDSENILQCKSYIAAPNQPLVGEKQAGLPQEIRCITSGYMVENYGYEHIIGAMGILNKEGIKITLTICHYGTTNPGYFEVVKQASESSSAEIIFKKRLNHQAFLNELEASHFYIRNTEHDAFGVALAEAVCSGTIPLATDVCERAEGSVLYTSRDDESIAEVVRFAINDYTNLSQKCRDAQKVLDKNYPLIVEAYSRSLQD